MPAPARYKTWNDLSAPVLVNGYVIEWDFDPTATTTTTSQPPPTTTTLTALPPPACGDAEAAAAVQGEIDAQCDCAGAENHGAYVRCAAHVAKIAAKAGMLPKDCKGPIKRCAAKSACGKPGFVTCCRTSARGAVGCSIEHGAAGCKAPRRGSACLGSRPSCCGACGATGCGP